MIRGSAKEKRTASSAKQGIGWNSSKLPVNPFLKAHNRQEGRLFANGIERPASGSK